MTAVRDADVIPSSWMVTFSSVSERPQDRQARRAAARSEMSKAADASRCSPRCSSSRRTRWNPSVRSPPGSRTTSTTSSRSSSRAPRSSSNAPQRMTRWHEPLVETREAVCRATALTRDLLDLSRRQPSQPKVVDRNAVVASADRMLLGASSARTSASSSSSSPASTVSGSIRATSPPSS